jgi:predicted nucleic acid-binding protein
MTYLIDSDRIADWLAGRPDAVQLLTSLRREGIISAVDQRRGRQAWRAFQRGVRILVLSRPVAERAAAIRVDLRRQKRQVDERALDILIAATAIEHELTLVTHNTRDYADISRLQLYQAT